MFEGGTDTTYTVLERAMTRLRHPRVLKNLQNEIAGIANGKQDMAEIDLEKMHYLKAVIKETLRLHPLIPLLAPCESEEEVKVKDYDIAARTMVFKTSSMHGQSEGTLRCGTILRSLSQNGL